MSPQNLPNRRVVGEMMKFDDHTVDGRNPAPVDR